MWDSKSQILIENSAPYLLLAQAITTERGRTHPHFGRSGQEQIALKKNVEHSEFALPRGSLGITHIFSGSLLTPTPLSCMPRGTPSAASPARSRSGGSRTVRECGRHIVGTHNHRPFRLS